LSSPPKLVELSTELKEAAQELVVDLQQVQVFVAYKSLVAIEDGMDREDYKYKDGKQ
jgi:hypothetical protein